MDRGSEETLKGRKMKESEPEGISESFNSTSQPPQESQYLTVGSEFGGQLVQPRTKESLPPPH